MKEGAGAGATVVPLLSKCEGVVENAEGVIEGHEDNVKGVRGGNMEGIEVNCCNDDGREGAGTGVRVGGAVPWIGRAWGVTGAAGSPAAVGIDFLVTGLPLLFPGGTGSGTA